MPEKGKDRMTMLSIEKVDHAKLKKLAARDGRTMRAAFKVMLQLYSEHIGK